ncbi:MAG: DUF4835 family protein [Bacteroidaceae bacterium]|nr:DUF4835 family protein [Bacteroidaceae bacterium]
MHIRSLFILLFVLTLTSPARAQELNAKVIINRSQVSNTKSGVFDALEKAVTQFLNERAWTELKFREQERIQCSFNITVNTYSETDNSFKASLLVASNRPVFDSNYTTTVWNTNDKDFDFTFQEFDQLDWRPEQIDNNLTAVLAYWAYMIIGLDLDSMSPMGGTEVLRMAQDICNSAEGLGYKGWKAFDDTKNRFAIVNDYLDGSMEKFRQLQYTYYRTGLDHMAENTEQARKAIAEAVSLLKQAHEDKSLSMLPQIFTDFKRDELVSIFSGQGNAQEREQIYDILFRINPSQNTYWEKLKQ